MAKMAASVDTRSALIENLRTLGNQKRGARLRAYAIAPIADVAFIVAAVIIAALVRFDTPDTGMLVSLTGFFVMLYLSIGVFSGGYDLATLADRRRFVERGLRSLLVSFLATILAFFTFKIGAQYSRLLIFLLAVLAPPFMAIGRFVLWPRLHRVLGTNALAELAIVDGVEAPPTTGSVVVSTADVGLSPDTSIESVSRLAQLAVEVDRIIVYCRPERREAWSEILRGLAVRSELRIPELDKIRPLSVYTRRGLTNAVVSENPLQRHQAATKRIFDLVVTILALVALAPVMISVAIAIKLDSPGPVLFRQRRIGLGNRPFMMLKFRSMRTDMQDHEARKLTARNDPRVTRVGAFIRKTSLDELPQFFNVLTGDMSIVGPRPHAPAALAGTRLYWEVDPKYWHRHVAKPGITGLAQVRGFRGNTVLEQDLQSRLDADLEYVADWSLLRDIEILVATFGVLRHDQAF